MHDTVESLLAFLNASPTPFHATANLARMFEDAGFTPLDERSPWALEAGQAYYSTRTDASIVAFRLGKDLPERGLRLVGAHTDSPCLKVKPCPDLSRQGYSLLGVETYGGVLLNPWFDRDLSIAGRVSGVDAEGQLQARLINFDRAIATIPSLAIHLNRTANENKTVNPQQEMNALLDMERDQNFRDLLLEQVAEEHADAPLAEVLDFNLCFYDMQAPALTGLNRAFLSSARLDNLLSCFLGAQALIHSDTTETAVLLCNDHEEVGSRSDAGAQGTLLNDCLARLVPDSAARHQTLRHSMMLSVDNAHGVHPNYSDKHDGNHGPKLNAGPVIKFDADQGYATNSDTAAFVRWLARQGEPIPLQSFVMRADMRCGSTIGPITATNSGIRTVDIGNAQFAMHSIRETAGVQDVTHMTNLLSRFYGVAQVP